MKFAITGGAGFLGYHLCRILAGRFDEILCIDIAPIDYKEYPRNMRYIKADVRDKNQIGSVLKGADLVIHAAAALPLWKKKDIYGVNIDGTRNVLESAAKNNIGRVVYVSSTAVYGVPEKHPLYETDPLIGVGPYGESKILAEKVCGEYRSKGMCIPVIRPKTFIGTGRLGVFQILYDWVESGRRIPVIGNGLNRYQLLEVEDLVEAIYILLTAPCDKVNSIFNVGAERFNTVNEDVGAMCRHANTGARVLNTPASIVIPMLAIFEKLGISPLYKWVYGTAHKDSFVSIDKMKTIFNWSPKYSNAEALVRSYDWYLEHKSKLSGTGVTHRIAWKQGILAVIKKVL